ncbi:MAG: hypothetical protein KDB26_05575 [Microthrixaceae bacterium]|nr:hypothetical protein [Microthrixaceae bacterium]
MADSLWGRGPCAWGEMVLRESLPLEYAMTVENCAHDQVEIAIMVDGTRLVMRSCSECDVRSWHRDGASVALDGVLHDIRSVPTRYRRALST